MICFACGKTFRSMSAEAKHRHNFPALCNRKSKAWKRFQEEVEAPKPTNSAREQWIQDEIKKANNAEQ